MASLKDMVSEDDAGDMVDEKGREVVGAVVGLSRGALRRLNRGRSLEMEEEVERRSSGAAICS